MRSKQTWTFLRARVPLAKKFLKTKVEGYPLVKRMTSSVFETDLSNAGLEEAYGLLKERSAKGYAMQQGPLTRQLKDESRKGMTNRGAYTHRLVIDVDGMPTSFKENEGDMTSETVRKRCERIIDMLPECFHDVSYIGQASASFGVKPGTVSFHIMMFMDEAQSTSSLKFILEAMNYQSGIDRFITLSEVSGKPHHVIDPKLAENSRIIFIAPPEFSADAPMQDPFASKEDRWCISIKDQSMLDTQSAMDALEGYETRKRKRLTSLRRAAGLPDTKVRTQNVVVGDKSITVHANPRRVKMVLYADRGDYVQYDVNDGDSHAYWVYKATPQIVYNFKEEMPFSFEQADPDGYVEHLKMFCGEEEREDGAVVKRAPVPMVFVDYSTDKGYRMLVDQSSLQFVKPPAESVRLHMAEFMNQNGGVMPDPVPMWDYLFDPTREALVDVSDRFVNKYEAPKMVTRPLDIGSIDTARKNGRDTIKEHFPTIFALMWSMCGYGEAEFDHFLNWFGCVVKHRVKTQTAWLFHGVPGTGKGAFFHAVARPLIGEEYTKLIRLANLEDQFTGWLATNILTVVDEFNIWEARTPKRVDNELKSLITEPSIPVRGMRREMVNMRSYLNMMLYSNNYDMMIIDPNDRRYNVAPRQEEPLRIQHPNIVEDIKTLLPDEVPMFCAWLLQMDADIDLARTALHNEAKQQLREAGQSIEEEFFSAVTNGDLEYFLPICDDDAASMAGLDFTLAAKLRIQTWLRDLERNPATLVSLEDLTTLYKARFSKRDVTSAVLEKKAQRWGMQFTQSQQEATYGRKGVRVRWVLRTLEIARTQRAYLGDDDFAKARVPVL